MEPTRQQVRAEARSNEFRDVTARFAAESRVVRRRIAGKRARTSWKQLATALGVTLGATLGPRSRRLALTLTALSSFIAFGTLAPPEARAQGSRKDDIVFNTRGAPLAGALVRVCAMPATGQPCTPLALIYSDAALTQALANPTSTDGLGNYFFFATPGKYMIEISGAGITTKQFANVILPSDPTSPTFSTITSTSGISGFSLTLTGNLTVNGSASVIGNLAFGTAQLTNQAVPPGAAPAGTVNVYTKTVDKRLYYKDDTGTEIGPVGTGGGVQANVTNTFTADQNIDANLRIKGPSPWIDVTRYGVRALTLPGQTSTATTTSGSANVSLPGGAADFINGDGFMVLGAGAACPNLQAPNQLNIAAGTGASRSANVVTITTTQRNDFVFFSPLTQTVTVAGVTDASFNGTFAITSVIGTPPTQLTYAQVGPNATSGGGTAQNLAASGLFATPHGILNGTTQYQYQVIAESPTGCLSAAGPVITTTTGPATLGLNTINISTVSRTAGIMTVTTTAAHNLEAKISQVKLNTGSAFNFDGTFTVFATPTATTFTIKQIGMPDIPPITGGTVQVAAQIWVKWLHVDGSARNYWVYRKIGVGAWTLAGPTQSSEPFYEDYNWGAPSAPGYVPAAPPSVAQNAPLVTTIVGGGGTTSLVLASVATSSVTAQTALHDNSVGFIAALTAASVNNGGSAYVPPTLTVGGLSQFYIFNAPATVLPSFSNGTQITVKVAGGMQFNGPLFLGQIGPTSYEFDGDGGFSGPGSFPMSTTPLIGGAGYPLVQLENAQNFRLSRLTLSPQQNQQHALVGEPNLNGGGVNSLVIRDCLLSANSQQGGVPAFFRGMGFNIQFDGNNVFSATAGQFYSPGAIHGGSYDIGNSAGGNGLAISSIDKVTLLGGGIVVENNIGVPAGNLAGNMRFSLIFGESQAQPLFRLNTNGANLAASDWTFDRMVIADGLVGQATAPFDFTGSAALLNNLTIHEVNMTTSGTLFEAGSIEPYSVFLPQNTVTSYVGLNAAGYLALMGQSVNTGDAFGVATHSVIENTSPMRLKFGGTIFAEATAAQLPTVSGVTAAAGGTLATGQHTLQVVGIDEAGAVTQPGPGFTFTVTAPNQTITATWTAMPGFTTYGLVDNIGQFANNSPQFAAGCNIVTGLTCTFSAPATGGVPLFSATGPTHINAGGVFAPNVTSQKLTLPDGLASGISRNGLMAEYKILPSETPGALIDYSGNGRNAIGTVGTAPTIIAGSGGLSFNGAGAVSLPAALNSALTVQIFYTNPFAGFGAGNQFTGLVTGSSTPANSSNLLLANRLDGGSSCVSIAGNRPESFSASVFRTFVQDFADGPNLLTWLMDANDRYFLNATELVQPISTAGSSAGLMTAGNYQLGGGAINAGTAALTYMSSGSAIYYAVFYNRILTQAELNRNFYVISQALQARGVAVTNQVTSVVNDNVYFAGDSITCGQLLTTAFPSALTLNNSSTITNGGVASASAFDMATSPADDNFFSPNASKNLFVMWAGTNDVAFYGRTVAQGHNSIAQTLRNRKALGWKTFVTTMADRSGASTAKNSLNALIRQNWTQYADGLIDVAEDVALGADGANTGACFQVGGIHPDQACAYNNLAPMFNRAINRFTGAQDFSTANVYAVAAPAATATTAGSETGNTVTLTMAANPCAAGQIAVVSGVTPAGYNSATNTGWYVLTSTATQITYFNRTAGLGAVTVQGTVSCQTQRDGDKYQVLNFGAGNYTLLPCEGYTGQNIFIKNINAAASTIVPFGTETIDGAANLSIGGSGGVVALQSILTSPTAAGCSWKQAK